MHFNQTATNLTRVVSGRILILFLGLSFLGGCGKTKDEEDAREIPIQLSSLKTLIFNDSVRVQGTLEAKSFALVPARIGGTVEKLFVDEGDRVEIGQSLCLIDREKLIQTVEIRNQELAVARSALEVSRAQLDSARADLKKARKDHDRFQRLVKDAAVTVDRFEQVETRKIGAEAVEKVVTSQIDLADARVLQAQALLEIARRDLADTTICSPIAGMVSHRFYELGEMAEVGAPAFRVDDTGVVELSAYLASCYYPRIIPGITQVLLRVAGEDLGRYPISYRSPTVDEKLRTFEIKCLLPEPPLSIAPGMMAQAEILLDSREGSGVPSGAVLLRGGETVIFSMESGRAVANPVTTGYTTDGMVEVISGLPETVREVVVKGQKLLDNGDRVRLIKESF